MTRNEKQDIIYNQIVNDKCVSFVEAATGFGKTVLGLRVAQKVSNSNLKTTVIVPTLKLKDQWLKLLKEWKIKNHEVYVVNTYVKFENYTTDLLILDEAHHYLSLEAKFFNKVIDITKYRYILALSATLNAQQKQTLEDYGIKCAGVVTVNEALRNGWISKFIEYNWFIDLTPEDRIEYNKLNNQFFQYFGYFYNNFDDAMGCLNKVYRQSYCLRRNLDDKKTAFAAIQFNRMMQERKKFLYFNNAKLIATKQIVEKFKVPTIIFSESTEFADNVTEMLGDICVSYHSNIKTQIIDGKKYGAKRLQELVLKKLLDGRTKVRVISTAKALNEGADFPKLEVGVIASGTSDPRVHTQRRGRLLRYVENKQALIINLVIKDTQDEKWLEKRQANSPGIPIDSLEEIESVML